MGKSSSSIKKIKHSRDSSKLRSVKKRKTKRNKSKKIRLIKDYSDVSESSGSDSSLYSSSEDDDYRRKKKRRSKLSKKRSRKRYSSSESESDDDDDDADDDTRLLRKKKRSKRKDEHVRKTKKKKISSKKRRKRVSSSSSTSSESNSSRDNRSDDDSESDGKRRSRVRGRRVSNVKASPKIGRDESEGDSEPDECWQQGDEVMPEENPRRLKSIVVVVSNTYDNDERVDDHDDVCLTHGGNREFGYNVESDEIDSGTTIPYSRTRADDYGCETVVYDHFGESNKSETSISCHIDKSMKEDDDLEAILKKRALENLKRFRGVTQRSGIARKEVSSVSEGEPMQIESKKFEESQYHGLIEQRLCDPGGSKDLEASENLIQVSNVKNTGTVLGSFASQQDRQSDCTAKVKASSGISSCTTKRKLVRPVFGKESLNLASRKEATCSQDAEVESINSSTIDKNCRETENGSENIEPVNLSFHADSETLEEFKGDSQSEQKTIDETKDESQYEQKTMTVMRGGELVQVSYKVYIPKKTSSLGRRKLKR